MKLLRKEATLIVCNDHEDWQEVSDTIVDHSRWAVQHYGVFKHIPTGKHYSVYWLDGATEAQDQEPFYDDEIDFTEMYLVERTVKVWEKKE